MKITKAANLLLAVCWLLTGIPAGAMYQGNGYMTILVKPGIAGEQISDDWKAALRSRMSAEHLDSLARLKRALTIEETAWQQLITSKTIAWNSYRDSLAVPFRGIVLQDTIFVMLGFLGNDDAFTHGSNTVCLDITALFRAYGHAGLPENNSRIDRIFSHEYTHLLHKQWAINAAYKPVTFKDSILWECFYEGMGMYRSLNSKWMPVNDSLPHITRSTLNDLYAVFHERMIAIGRHPALSDIEKERLHVNLSRGPVNKKWGAFPVAIWLLLEAGKDESRLAKWIDNGPGSVILLAKKHLPAALEREFSAVFVE